MTVRCRELVKREAGELAHDIVDGRFEAGIAALCHRVQDLVQRQADGQLRRDLGDRISRGLAGQGARSRYARIDLDDIVSEALWIQRQLHVAASADLQGTYDLQRCASQHLVLAVGQCLHRGHDDAVAGMDPHRIHVLHAADDDRIVVGITDHFVFDLLVAGDALFDQALMHRRDLQPGLADAAKLFLIVRKASAGPAKGVGRAHDHRIT